jgi:hypothetical protein
MLDIRLLKQLDHMQERYIRQYEDEEVAEAASRLIDNLAELEISIQLAIGEDNFRQEEKIQEYYIETLQQELGLNRLIKQKEKEKEEIKVWI